MTDTKFLQDVAALIVALQNRMTEEERQASLELLVALRLMIKNLNKGENQ